MTPKQVKEWRQAKGWDQKRAAQELDVSIHTVRAWEQGKNPVPAIVEKYLVSEIDLKVDLDLVSALHEIAAQKGVPFQEALTMAIRQGLLGLKAGKLPRVKAPLPKSGSSAKKGMHKRAGQ